MLLVILMDSCLNKISIIIPTMQKDIENLNILIDELENDECVDEIILIDNSLCDYNKRSDKLKVCVPKENLYVNPSWNLGVKLAKNNYIGILNDDILLPKNFIPQVVDFITNTKNCGVVGIESSTSVQIINNKDYSLPKERKLLYKKIENIYKNKNWYWGTAIFTSKDNYYMIPEEMLIYCGDDYLLYKNKKNKKQNYAIYNVSIKHYGSLTSSSKKYRNIKKEDINFFSAIDKDYRNFIKREHLKKKFKENFRKLFSVNNVGIRKVICIFGIKIKFKLVGRH